VHDDSHKLYPYFLLVFTVFITFFLGLGHFPLFDLDEGAFSSATMDMQLRGDWVTPYLNGELRGDKPIFIYWCQLLSIKLFGLNEWGLRFPSAMAASIWIVAIYNFAKDYVRTNSQAIALIGAFSLFSLVIGRAATADALLNLFMTLTCLSIWRYLDSPSKKRAYLTYLWMGLGFLTKGPVAVAIPFLLLTLFCLKSRQYAKWKQAVFFFPGWGLFIAIALPWYIAITITQGWDFLQSFILDHNLGRFSNTMENHGGSPFFYLPVLLFICLPFSGVLIRSLFKITIHWHKPVNQFMYIWFAIVFLIFSFSQTQLPHYLMYGIPPLWFLMGQNLEESKQHRTLLSPIVIFAIILLILPIALAFSTVKPGSDSEFIFSLVRQHFGWGYYLSVISILPIVGALWYFRDRLTLTLRIFILGLSSAFLVLYVVVPIIADAQQAPVREAALIAKAADKDVSMIGVNMPSFSVYLGQPTPSKTPEPNDWIFTRTSRLHNFADYKVIYQRGNVSLIEIQPVSEEN